MPASFFTCDRDDIFEAHLAVGHKFCLSGGVPNILLSHGSAEEVRDFCTRVIREVAAEGGYIMDAGAIMQDDTKPENLRALTDTCREEGGYSPGSFAPPTALPPSDLASSLASRGSVTGMSGRPAPLVPPGVCRPWESKRQELGELPGDIDLIRKVWNDIEGLSNTFIWQVLLSF
jgi:hypothetical protein